MSVSPVIFAQAAIDAENVSAPQVIAGMCVMTAMAGSLLMIALWMSRRSRGNEVMPCASRKPLFVPLPICVCGLALAVFMALLVASSGAIDPKLNEQMESAKDATTAKNDQPDTDAADSSAAASPETANQKESPESEVVESLDQQFRRVIIANINSNLMVFLFFGGTILLSQMARSRAVTSADDIGYDSIFAQQLLGDAASDVSEVPQIEPISRAEELSSGDKPDLATTDESIGATEPVYERWVFRHEFIFALEAFLIAYLPTTVVRIAFVSSVPDAPSHPFLKMIETGVDGEIIALILFMAVFVAPVVEELLFRVTILGGIMQRNWFPVGFVVSSVLFGLAHGFPDCVALLPLAFVIGYTFSRRRSYRTAVLVHLLFNAFNMLLAGLAIA